MKIVLRSAQLCVLAFFASALCLAEALDSPTALQHYLQAGPGSGSGPLRDNVAALYQAADYQLLWSNPATFEQLQTAIADSYNDGLNPADYQVASLADHSANDTTADIEHDIATSAALVTLLDHLRFGKVDPRSLHAEWSIEKHRQPLDHASILDAIRNQELVTLIQGSSPSQAIYQNLKAGLAQYRQIQADGGWPTIYSDTIVKPEERHAVVPLLRQRLRASGDFTPAGESEDPGELFDTNLAEALKQFQRRHLLAADGRLGPLTLQALNQPVGQRINQIRANLERMRWFLHDLEDTYLLADIAAYKLYLVQDNQFTWSSDIQVGKPYRQTPVLKSRITYLEWNPSWIVPPTILNEDMLPAIHRDINYLRNNHLEVLTYQREWVDPTTIDWSLYPQRPFPYMLRQRPGRWNALGTVKFIFPNNHLVYLHDTPDKRLFQASSRAFSSGCIRVDRTYSLAKLLLGIDGPAADAQIEDILNSGKTRRQYLPQSFPIVLLYWTTRADHDGSLIFAVDIYERDERVIAALDAERPGRHSPLYPVT
jgi:murein L,D-transpeptidase YcbB/YkuD